MATVRWPEVVDALVALLRAETGYRAPLSPGSGVPVYDGPQADSDVLTEPSALVIGWSPGNDAGEIRLEPRGATAARTRDEASRVRCVAVASSGNMKAARDAAFAILATVETVTRTNPDLGLGSASGFKESIPTDYEVRQTGHSQGYTCQVDFSLDYTAFL